MARRLDAKRRVEWGQFLTPPAVAHFMASLFQPTAKPVRLLDAGAGVGALTAAFVAEACRWPSPPASVSVTAYEIDAALADYLRDTLEACRVECERVGVSFAAEVRGRDFIEASAKHITAGLFEGREAYTHAILTPPYRKINSGSEARLLLRSVGVETSNLYTAFLSLTTRLLEPAGELAAITPRSFCNGPYFKSFRREFLAAMTFRRVHVFEARHLAFGDDDVLQENIIFRAVKQAGDGSAVLVSSSTAVDDEALTIREVPAEQFVHPDDPDAFIRIVPDELGYRVAARMGLFTATLADLGITVSTGRVVDFRATGQLRREREANTVPLIYPHHFRDGYISHPVPHSKKANWIVDSPNADDLLVPSGVYVLVKRFSAKEEQRRVVAAVYDPERTPAPRVGFENHLNYFHEGRHGLSCDLARGLAAFLNSSLVDAYFRQFNGHTQVNAADLRSLKYPTRAELDALGAAVGNSSPDQDTLDQLIATHLPHMSTETSDPIPAKRGLTKPCESSKLSASRPRSKTSVRR